MAHTEFQGGFGFPACDESAPFIFVSYAHQDADRIVPYVRHLSDNGIRIWYDSGLHAGEDWLNMLLSKISSDNCTAVMLFVSNESIGRPFVRAETHHAFSVKKPIYAIYLEDNVVVDPSMNAYIGQIQSTFITRHSDPASAKDEMLAAAQLLIRRTPPVAQAHSRHSIDELCRDAEISLGQRNANGEYSGIEHAEAKYRTITEQFSNDPRGWLGLLRCRSMTVPTSPEHAAQLLADSNNYYCYVINCAPDDGVVRQCEQYINALWTAVLDMFDRLAESSKNDSEVLGSLHSKLPDSRLLTSVSPSVTARYTGIEEKLKTTAVAAASKNKTVRGIKRILAAVDVCLYVLISILLIFTIAGDLNYVLTNSSSAIRHSVPVYIVSLCITVAMLVIHCVAAAVVRKHAKAGKATALYRFAAAVMAISWVFPFFMFIFIG